MNRLARIWLLASILGLACLSGIPTAAAAPSAAEQSEAHERYDRGVMLFKEGDYRAALIEFQRAHELAPNFAVLYNIGQVYYQLKDYANSLVTLEQYLAEGGKRVSKKRRKQVRSDIAKLKPRVALLEVEINVAGAEILIDDVTVGSSPLEGPLTVSAGRRKVTVIGAGQEPVTKYVDIAGSEDAAVSFSLSRRSPSSSPDDDEDDDVHDVDESDSASDSSSPDLVWIGWVVTGAFSVASIITGAMALGAQSDLEQERAGQTSREQLDSAADSAFGLAVATDVLIGGAVVAGAVTLIVMLVSDDDGEASADATIRPSWRPTIEPGGAGLVLRF